MKAVEIQVINESKKGKNRENLPDELRIKIYERVIELHQQGLSYNKIVKIIEQEFGVRLPKSTIGRWVQGRNKPYNRIYIPSLKLLEPSEELAYVIGVMIGDGYIYKYIYAFRDGRIVERYRIGLKAKDKEFVGEFARCLAIVLNRPSIKLRYNQLLGKYIVRVGSKALYELLSKPIDLNKLKKFIEHCPRCITAFLRGFFDSEGSVDKNGYISAINSDYELLMYVQELLERFGIKSTGPRLQTRRGSITIDPRTKKRYLRRKDVYKIRILARCNDNFYYYIGFTIKRKLERLENFLKRTGEL